MFVLAGTKNKLKKKGESKEILHCTHCGYNGKFHYSVSRTYSTVFFVPVAPLPLTKTEYLHCPKCSYGVELTKANREEYMEKIILDGDAEPENQKIESASQTIKKEEKAKQYNKEGLDYFNQEKYELAYDRFMKAMTTKPDEAVYVFNIGETFRCNNDFDNAKLFYERSGNMGYADGFSRIAYLYMPGTFASWTIERVDNPNMAIYWFTKSIELLSENDKSRLAPRLNNIAICHDRLNNHAKAAAYMWLALKFGNESSKDDYNLFKTKVPASQQAQIEKIFSIPQLRNFLQNLNE